jgi:hypothetical protein
MEKLDVFGCDLGVPTVALAMVFQETINQAIKV